MEVYELGYLILPSIPKGELSLVVDKLKAIVAKVDGKEIEGEEPFKYPLAYTMSKTIGASRYVVNDAYLGWMKFELDPSQTLEVKMAVEHIEEVLRSLIIKVPRETTFTFAKAEALLAEKKAREAALMAGEVEEPSALPAENFVETKELVVE